jgi:hypothetical protein
VSSTKAVFLILILVAVAFAVVLGLGLGGKDAGPPAPGTPQPAWVDGLAGWLVTRAALKPSEVTCQGFDAHTRVFTVQKGRPSDATIGRGETRVRDFTLGLRQGEEVDVDFKPEGKQGMPVQQSLKKGDEPLKLQAPAEGARLTLTWKLAAGAAPCEVALGD